MQRFSEFLLLLVLCSASAFAQNWDLDGSLRQRVDRALSAVDATDPEAVAQSVGKVIDANKEQTPAIVHYAVRRLSERLGNRPDIAERVIPAVTRIALRSALRTGSAGNRNFKRVLPPDEDPDCPYPVVMGAVGGLTEELRPIVTPRILEAALWEVQDPRCRAKIMQSILAMTDDRSLRNRLVAIATANGLTVDGNGNPIESEDFIGGDGFGQGVGNVGGVFPGAGGGAGGSAPPVQPTPPPSAPTPPPPTPAPPS